MYFIDTGNSFVFLVTCFVNYVEVYWRRIFSQRHSWESLITERWRRSAKKFCLDFLRVFLCDSCEFLFLKFFYVLGCKFCFVRCARSSRNHIPSGILKSKHLNGILKSKHLKLLIAYMCVFAHLCLQMQNADWSYWLALENSEILGCCVVWCVV